MTNLYLKWSHPEAAKNFRTGVSLHSHTSCSKETLSFVPRHTANVPILAKGIRKLEDRFRYWHGYDLDYKNVWWTPPLTPRDALELETKQIEDLGLRGMVSLSDHDSVDAGVMVAPLGAPISVEWTIPLDPVFFHIGVHNIPADMMPMLAEATADPRPERVNAAFAALHERPETLVILNHPLWDEVKAGRGIHDECLKRLLDLYGHWFHALEMNGLRPWQENKGAREMAESMGIPAVSGGDRHGLEPNANINLTNAVTFAEFVDEIRVQKRSEVLFMPQYREPIRLRMIRVMCDVLRDLPGSLWNDRIFWRNPDGVVRRLSEVMGEDSAPGVIGVFLTLIRLADRRNVQYTLRWALADRQELVL